MKKMSAPKLEVICFSTEDVIVTSGLLGTDLSPNKWYATIGSELKDGQITTYKNRLVNDNTRYWFQFGNNSVYNLTSSTSDVNTDGATYAWFYKKWRTGDLFYDFESSIPDLNSFTEYYSN